MKNIAKGRRLGGKERKRHILKGSQHLEEESSSEWVFHFRASDLRANFSLYLAKQVKQRLKMLLNFLADPWTIDIKRILQIGDLRIKELNWISGFYQKKNQNLQFESNQLICFINKQNIRILWRNKTDSRVFIICPEFQNIINKVLGIWRNRNKKVISWG